MCNGVFGSNNCIWILVIILLLVCCGGNNGCGCADMTNNGCGCC